MDERSHSRLLAYLAATLRLCPGMEQMELRLLGEVQVLAAGRALDAGTPRQQAVLAALAVEPGRPVPIEALVDRVWGEEPPAEPRNVLYSHLSRIRRLLERAGAGLERRHAGYV